MGKIIAFANQKGGVGKTTSAVNIAASLGVLGKRVLMIDLDPQGNTTSGLGVGKRNLTETSRELLLGESAEAKSTVVKTEFENLSLIPSNKTLASVEFELYEVDEPYYRLKEALRELRNEYDYIIIDCPPSLGMITANALVSADGIVIPMQCEFYSLEGLSQLVLTINKIRQTYNKTLNVTGILITMYNGRLVLSNQVMAELKKHYKDKLFKTPISRGVKLSEAPGFGMPVYYHDKNCKGTAEYMAVAKELLGRI
jgi:chromosome partitioning protein